MIPKKTASFALSQNATLSDDQRRVIAQIEQYVRHCRQAAQTGVFWLEGEAGTGKSVLLHHLFARLQSAARCQPDDILFGSQNVLLVNHAEMIKAYRHAAEGHKSLRKKDYLRPTTWINRRHVDGQSTDVVLVDEAHLLLTRPDPYNHFRHQNQLQEILRLAPVVIVAFDQKQVLKCKSYWDEDQFIGLLRGRSSVRLVLHQQWRMRASLDIIKWIRAFHQGQLLAIPRSTPDFELRIFTDPVLLYQAIVDQNTRVGRSRLLATYDFPYVLDGKDHLVKTGRLCLRWDRALPNVKLAWADRPDTIDEIGSVYTVQGFDLNYVGLILGPSVQWDRAAQRLHFCPQLHHDTGAFQGKANLRNPISQQQELMRNAMHILMTRAVCGLYVYAHDAHLRRQLAKMDAQARSGNSHNECVK